MPKVIFCTAANQLYFTVDAMQKTAHIITAISTTKTNISLSSIPDCLISSCLTAQYKIIDAAAPAFTIAAKKENLCVLYPITQIEKYISNLFSDV